MCYFTTGGPGEACRTNKLSPTWRIQERSKGERRHPSICPTNLPESFSLESIFTERCVCHRKDPKSERWAKENPETNPIAIYPETASHGAALHQGAIKLLALSARVSLYISFPRVRQRPTLGPWKGSPFLKHYYSEELGRNTPQWKQERL